MSPGIRTVPLSPGESSRPEAESDTAVFAASVEARLKRTVSSVTITEPNPKQRRLNPEKAATPLENLEKEAERILVHLENEGKTLDKGSEADYNTVLDLNDKLIKQNKTLPEGKRYELYSDPGMEMAAKIHPRQASSIRNRRQPTDVQEIEADAKSVGLNLSKRPATAYRQLLKRDAERMKQNENVPDKENRPYSDRGLRWVAGVSPKNAPQIRRQVQLDLEIEADAKAAGVKLDKGPKANYSTLLDLKNVRMKQNESLPDDRKKMLYDDQSMQRITEIKSNPAATIRMRYQNDSLPDNRNYRPYETSLGGETSEFRLDPTERDAPGADPSHASNVPAPKALGSFFDTARNKFI